MNSFETSLKEALRGEVYFDEVTRHVYSVDASIFEVVPRGVVLPKDLADLQAALEIAAAWNMPVTVRGAATGIAGGCLGSGLVVDLSKSFTQIRDIDIPNGTVICQPGVVQDDLNRQLAPLGYRLGPDTSSGNRATLGGMLGNNAAGARSLRYGKTGDHVREVELLLSDGQTITFSDLSEDEWEIKRLLANREGDIYRTLWEIKEEDSDEIKKRFPSIPRAVSGYNLPELLNPFPFNVSKLIAGSEGTLGIATNIKLNIVPKPKALGLLLLFFDDLVESLKCVPELLQYAPLALELIDNQVIALGRTSPLMRGKLDWLVGNPEAILIFELEGDSDKKLTESLQQIKVDLNKNKIGTAQTTVLDARTINHVWECRKAGQGLLLSKRSYSRAIAFLEDISLPPEALAPFMQQFCAYLKRRGKEAGIYGHAGAGCMHIRPYMDLRQPEEATAMRDMMLEISSLLLEYGGSLSGEHGDGLIRSWLNPKMFGARIFNDFKKIKHAFDPVNLMNPGKIIPLGEPWEGLRTQPNVKFQSPKTFLDFNAEGGFELAADLCNGNGACRKPEGVMCPSFQATREEFHSTRARAQALRSIIHQRLPLEAFTSSGLHDVMDLCLSCKGCKSECPAQVDMAKFKSEFLYHYQEKHGYSLRTLLFGHIGRLNYLLSPFASWFNRLSQSNIVKRGLDKIGISANRSLPPLAKKRFSSWFKRYPQPHLAAEVVLLNDTFTEFNHPEIGHAAIRLLNACGYRVLLANWSCCGRPALSKGLLPTARKQARGLIRILWPYAKMGKPIIGLEPSCLLTLRDDYASLLPGEELAQLKHIADVCVTLDEFLANESEKEHFKALFKAEIKKVKVHGHCYQKSLIGMGPTLKVLQAIPGFHVEHIPSGCCGMAGSFGYEKEHVAISMKIGELQLFPAIRGGAPEELIIASGMSCRHQIADGTGRQALHLAQALANHLLF